MQLRERSARGIEAPDTAPAVLRAIEAPYLSPDERAAARTFHGLWIEGDLANPALRAPAALIAGAYNDASLRDASTPAELCAEAGAFRGEYDQALALIQNIATPRAVRLRAQCLESLGRFQEARAALEPLVKEMQTRPFTSAPELVEGVRALAIRARLEGQPARDYHSMLALLIRAQQEIDRLYWPAILAQAELLFEKDNWPEAGKAATEVLALNPSCAAAWRILGLMSVESFNFDKADAIAARLNELTRTFDPDPRITSPDADIILCRSWMRQNDPVFAQGILQSTLDRFPLMREPLALNAACEALMFESERADALLDQFDEVSPGSPLAVFEIGRALSDARQYERAAEYLERASALQPRWAPPLIELGLLEMQAGRDIRALSALRRAAELDEFNTRAVNSLRLVDELTRYDSVESEHFIIRHTPGVDGVMAREMTGPLEEIHTIVGAEMRHEPAQKTIIELLPDHEWFAVRITGMTGIHTIAASTGPVLAMEAPKVGKKHLGEYDWVRVLRHEYTHTVTLSRTKNRIPHWFTEAAAVHMELAPREYETCQMLVGALLGERGFALFNMSQINVAFVRPAKQSDRAQAYAQGHWMYQYILEKWGSEAPLRMMDLYAIGIKEDQAMQSVLGVSQEDFVASFREWARADAVTWGMLPDVSLHELLLRASLADPDTRKKAEESLAAYALGTAMRLAGVAGARKYKIDLLEPTPEVIERMLGANPAHPDVLELKLHTDLEQNANEPTPEMIPTLEAYANARPVDPMPRRHLAKLLLAGDNPASAIPHLEYLDIREQKSAAYAVQLSRLYASQGEWDKAWTKAVRATQIGPFEANYREFAATVAVKRADFAAAEQQVEALTELEPQFDVHRERLKRIRELKAQ